MIAFNLTRAAAVLHTRTRTATVRTQLIDTPARLAHSAHLAVEDPDRPATQPRRNEPT